MRLSDTICAVATPPGEGGIGVIRISGPDAIPIASSFLKTRDGRNLVSLQSRHVVYGSFVDPLSGGIMDEVLCFIMRSPRTYTGEDVVEISAHGNPRMLSRMIEMLLRRGARLADKGEFTKRAFLNGKMDLTQAEGVMDLVKARTASGMDAAMDCLGGKLGRFLKEIRLRIFSILLPIEAGIDFPDEEVPPVQDSVLETRILALLGEIEKVLKGASAGRIMREGLCAVIAGKTNAGKSSLLNALLCEGRAIVTDIPGTTRDTVEEWADIKGVPVKLVDTAGIRSSTDKVEQMGILRSREALSKGDIILLVLDRSTPIESYDLELLEMAVRKKSIVILNKMDLNGPIEPSDVKKIYPGPLVCLSVLRNQGLDLLEEKISEEVLAAGPDSETPLLTHLRHQECLEKACSFLRESLETVRKNYPLDLVALDLRGASEAIGEITGEHYTEDLLNRIFSEFCIGK